MCCYAGIRVKKTFTSFKEAYSTILQYTYLHHDSEDYEIHTSEQIKSEHFSILLFLFFSIKKIVEKCLAM